MLPIQNPSANEFIDSLRNMLEQNYGVGQVVLTKLVDDSGAIAILPMRDDRKSNAYIYDVPGNVRCEIEIPDSFRNGIGFADAYYVNSALTVIFVIPGRDFAFVIDEKTGKVTKAYETK